MTEPNVLVDGLALGESPRWHEGRLWFSDWMAHQVLAADLDGKTEVILESQDMPFCIDFLPDGRLLVVSGRQGRLLRQEPDGSLVSHADLRSLSIHPWNDITLDGRGNVFVNNIGFDFPAGEFAPGIIALVGSHGSARQAADGLAFPNGMVVTPDDSTLIVAESYGERLTAFDIAADGSLSNRRTWAPLPGGHPDGICLDADGAVWYADVPAQRCVRVREGGEVAAAVDLDRGCFACALGGPDGKTLFMVAADFARVMGPERTGQVLTAEAPAAGAGWS
ncbi:MAG TPA: SMP-30/gluconolactonase/LRE family protein [Actinomycetota bacterium]|nr:SMP-30/gluconolactonase/LRE family protein [Actinomycetota bacterium]